MLQNHRPPYQTHTWIDSILVSGIMRGLIVLPVVEKNLKWGWVRPYAVWLAFARDGKCALLLTRKFIKQIKKGCFFEKWWQFQRMFFAPPTRLRLGGACTRDYPDWTLWRGTGGRPPGCVVGVTRVSLHRRINLSPFTKDFRGEEPLRGLRIFGSSVHSRAT